ncbi:CRE-PQN-68 protein [Entophlyctis helioformis]|nr:CRE-PQN-68 protein [Entophlyctis helioformis]
MRAVLQRVTRASVTVDGTVVSAIGPGLCVLVGLKESDTIADVDYIVKKLLSVRVFGTKSKPWSANVTETGGSVLCVSQFTLYGRTAKGTKPDFHVAMKSDRSRDMYETFLSKMRSQYSDDRIQDGVFGAMMAVEIVNDGPVTLIFDTEQKT